MSIKAQLDRNDVEDVSESENPLHFGDTDVTGRESHPTSPEEPHEGGPPAVGGG